VFGGSVGRATAADIDDTHSERSESDGDPEDVRGDPGVAIHRMRIEERGG